MCKVEDCSKPKVDLGYCQMHARRFRKHGDASVVLRTGRKPKAVEPQIPKRLLPMSEEERQRATTPPWW